MITLTLVKKNSKIKRFPRASVEYFNDIATTRWDPISLARFTEKTPYSDKHSCLLQSVG